MPEVSVPYEPRPQFMPLHTRKQRWAVCVAHRRCGKTVGTLNDLISMALYTDKERARYAYIAPFYSQAKQIAWDYLVHYTSSVAVKVSISSLSVDLFNGARITLYGADNPDSFRGLYFDGVVIDEYGDCKPNLWTEIIRPALSDRRGWATFIGTPNGLNHFYDIWEFAKAHPDDWFTLRLPQSATHILDADEVQEMRALMSEDEFEQEIECSFMAATRGAFYSNELKKAHIGSYPLDPSRPANYVFDLGYTDSTAIWRWTEYPDAIEVNLSYEQDNRSIQYYIDWLHAQRTAGITIGDVWLPHDAMAKTLQTGRSIVEQFLSGGIRPKVVAKLDLLDGIQAARMLFPSIFFDEQGCKDGLLALRSYRRIWNAERNEYGAKPVHDWSSNYADAFRYLALVAKCREDNFPAAPRPHAREINYGFCLDDLWKTRSDDRGWH